MSWGGGSRVSSVKWMQKKEKDDVKDCEREEREQRSEGERKKEKAGSQLNWRGREEEKGGRWIEREDERWRDMAHLLLLSGCREIAGFPRSANCGSEFFHCLSPPRSLSLPPPLTCTFSISLILSVPPVSSLSLGNGLNSYFFSSAVVISD